MESETGERKITDSNSNSTEHRRLMIKHQTFNGIEEESFKNTIVTGESYDLDKQKTISHSQIHLEDYQFQRIDKSSYILKPGFKDISKNDIKISDQCQCCEKEIKKESRKFCNMCGESFCKKCTTKQINRKTVCDICLMKCSNMKSETKKENHLRLLKHQNQKLKAQIENEYQFKIVEQKKEIASLEEELKMQMKQGSVGIGRREQQLKDQEENIKFKKQMLEQVQKQVNDLKQMQYVQEKQRFQLQSQSEEISKQVQESQAELNQQKVVLDQLRQEYNQLLTSPIYQKIVEQEAIQQKNYKTSLQE